MVKTISASALDIDFEQNRLLATLEQLLSIQVTDVKSALDQVSDLVTQALGADKVDIFLYTPSIDTLVAVGASDTDMARLERGIGMDRLPLANGGRTVEVFQTGISYSDGHADQDAGVLLGVRTGLHVQSMMLARFGANGERRGVLQALSKKENLFSRDDLLFLEAVSHWIGLLTYQAELAEKMSQEAIEEAKRVTAEELVLVLAHDLGNFLTPLIARIEFIRARARREKHTANLKDAEDAKLAVTRLQALIKDLLDIARVEQDIFALSLQPVDLVVLTRDSASVIGTRTADILLDLPDELLTQADPSRIRQVIENLLGNAIKHSPKLTPVHVKLRSETRDEQEWAVLEVCDDGPGIPPAFLPKLFTRFGSGPGSIGLGLGLYLAHSIAIAHGGTLTVETALGQGSTFSLSLPIS